MAHYRLFRIQFLYLRVETKYLECPDENQPVLKFKVRTWQTLLGRRDPLRLLEMSR